MRESRPVGSLPGSPLLSSLKSSNAPLLSYSSIHGIRYGSSGSGVTIVVWSMSRTTRTGSPSGTVKL